MRNDVHVPEGQAILPCGTLRFSVGFRAGRAFRFRLCLALAGALLAVAHAQLGTPAAFTTQSHSGQFSIHSPASSGVSNPDRHLSTNSAFVRLDPMLLTVSCERIKQLLWRELGAANTWRGKVYLNLYSGAAPGQPIDISPEPFPDGWRYRMDLPEFVERSRFIRAMVQVLLLEQANRNSEEHTAEIPLWLIEGLSQELLSSSEVQIILPPPTTPINGVLLTSAYTNAPRADPLEQAHRLLQLSPPLTFEQLSWPTEDQLAGEPGKLYGCCAQLFVHSLLRLEDGRACMEAMLADLPHFYNWQLAFLRAFHSHFGRPLDIEKWWALQLVHFTGRELAQSWPAAESWLKLDQTLRWPAESVAATNETPRSETSLQTIIREWDRPRQAQALNDKVRELEMLRLRVAPEFVELVEDYRRALAAYLQELPKAHFKLLGKKTGLDRAAEQTIKQLDALDTRRASLRPAPPAV